MAHDDLDLFDSIVSNEEETKKQAVSNMCKSMSEFVRPKFLLLFMILFIIINSDIFINNVIGKNVSGIYEEHSSPGLNMKGVVVQGIFVILALLLLEGLYACDYL